jgi:membrane protein DedA with SNARE-associated domain
MTDILLAPGSYLAIILVLALGGAGLPVPEEVAVITGGILSANGSLDPWLAFASCLFGAVLGDCVMYWVGYHFGRGLLCEHRWWARYMTPEREEKIEAQFRRHGLKVFFVARFLVGLRSPVYLTAGILQVSFRRFFLIDLICAASVVSAFFGVTYYFGQSIAQWVSHFEVALTTVVVVASAGAGIFLWRRYRKKLAAANKEKSPENLASLATPREMPKREVPKPARRSRVKEPV